MDRKSDAIHRRLRLWIPECEVSEVDACQLVYPFNGSTVGHDGYDSFAARGQEIFERTSIEDADFAVLPFDGNALIGKSSPSRKAALASAQIIVQRAGRQGLKTLVVANVDNTRPIPLPEADILVLRPSIIRSRKRPNEFALPVWHDDVFRQYCNSQLQIRPWRNRPSVGFCGLAGRGRPPLTRRFKSMLQRLGIGIPHNDGVWLRAASMASLNRSDRVRTSFIVRDGYFGAPADDDRCKQRSREEYIRNILDNDYALCVRGWGNHSFRTYEALSLGRPLLFLDTDCVLPLEELVNYEEVMLRVDQRDLRYLADRLADFHSTLNALQFEGIQQRARDLWEKHLSPLGFYRTFATTLLARYRIRGS